GVYRSRDSGSTWSSMAQMLWGQPVDSLAISSDGRHIHAGVQWGAFDLDLVSGPADVAASTSGGARVLRWSSDRLAVQTVDGSDNWPRRRPPPRRRRGRPSRSPRRPAVRPRSSGKTETAAPRSRPSV